MIIDHQAVVNLIDSIGTAYRADGLSRFTGIRILREPDAHFEIRIAFQLLRCRVVLERVHQNFQRCEVAHPGDFSLLYRHRGIELVMGFIKCLIEVILRNRFLFFGVGVRSAGATSTPVLMSNCDSMTSTTGCAPGGTAARNPSIGMAGFPLSDVVPASRKTMRFIILPSTSIGVTVYAGGLTLMMSSVASEDWTEKYL